MFEPMMQVLQVKQNTEQQIQAIKPIASVAEIKTGYFYAMPRKLGGYNIFKVLAMDDKSVHIRSYSNVYLEVPIELNVGSLFMKRFDTDVEAIDIGLAHLPVSYDTFMAWDAIAVDQYEEVTDDQLAGYRLWQEADGGYFNSQL